MCPNPLPPPLWLVSVNAGRQADILGLVFTICDYYETFSFYKERQQPTNFILVFLCIVNNCMLIDSCEF